MSHRSRSWLLGASGLVLAQVIATFTLGPSFRLIVFSDITQAALLLSGTLALLLNALGSQGRTRLFWLLMTTGFGLWFGYQMLWTYFEVFLRQEVPNPWAGDIVLFLHIVPMMAAMALQPHREQDERIARLGALDFALLLVWWLYLYLFAVIPWQYAQANEPAYSRNLNVLYLTEKMVFLGVLAIVWSRSQGSWKTIYKHWFGASLVYALSSYVANWAIAAKTYYTGSFYDLPLVASMAWLTAVGLLARGASAAPAPVRTSQRYGVWVARLGMIAVFSLPLFAAWVMYHSAAPVAVKRFRLVVSLGALLIMGLMVFIKQHVLDRELLDLIESSKRSFEDLKQLQGQLVKSEKMASLGHLLGGAAHELNNPLTAMLGYSDLLGATVLGDSQRELADKIGQQVRRTKTLVSSLLNFAQQTRTEKTVIDLNMLAQTVMKLSEPQWSARKIEIRTVLAEDLPPVHGDSNQLLQVCLHIANDALLALADTGGCVTIRSYRRDGFAILEFCDRSSDTSFARRAADFDATTAGLGLGACHGIIQEHNGRITCQPRPDGEIAFQIELPAATSLTTRPNPASERSQQLALHSASVLSSMFKG